MKQKGTLQSWHVNGYGMVSVGVQLFFLHRKSIIEGDWLNPAVGSLVEFEVGPAYRNGRFPQAINATVTEAEKVEPKVGA